MVQVVAMYKKFSSYTEAHIANREVCDRLNYIDYSDCIPHPTKQEALLKYRPDMLIGCEDIFEGIPALTLDEAVAEGWYLGPFQGRLGKTRAKLEEAQHLSDTLESPQIRDNRPVFRALFFAYISALYSLRESLKKVCPVYDGKLKDWWAVRIKELATRGELLSYLLEIGNRDKHNHENFLRYPANITYIKISYQLPPGWPPGKYPVVISGEGNFAMFDVGKKTFRRIPLGLSQGEYKVDLIGAPARHLGVAITDPDVLSLCRLVREYFEEVVFRAEQLELGRR